MEITVGLLMVLALFALVEALKSAWGDVVIDLLWLAQVRLDDQAAAAAEAAIVAENRRVLGAEPLGGYGAAHYGLASR